MATLKHAARVFLCAVLSFAAIVSFAASPEVDRGIAWLGQQPRADGSVAGDAASIATAFQARTETQVTLKQLGTALPALADGIAQVPADNVEYAARQVIALAPTGRNVSAIVTAILAVQNADGGFGAAAGYQSNALDTALALLALKAAGSASSTAAAGAVGYLRTAQATDGSFAINEQPSVYITAYALQVFNAYAQNFTLTTQAQSARQWLVAQQASGAYAATVDNAIAVTAIAGQTTDTTAFAGAVAALKNAQSPDGSWSSDPYLTAVAIRALVAAGTPPAPPTTGQISGTVVDASTGIAISGVAVTVTAGSATTDASGAFNIGALGPGTYSVQFARAGYTTQAQSVTVTAGVTTAMPTVRLALAANTSALEGSVRDAATGLAVAAATVSANGVSVQTDPAGKYRLAGIPAGTATVTVTQSGYQSISVAATLPDGATVFFSPSLYPSGATVGATTLAVTVVSASTSQPISGASVSAAGATATTSSSGQATLTGLAPGAATLSATASGYLAASAPVLIAPGTNVAPTIALGAAAQTATLSGTITDSVTLAGIGGATVRIDGTSLSATTNAAGQYQLAGISTTQFSVTVSAAGYASKTVSVTLSQLGDGRLDTALVRTNSGGLVVVSTVAENPSVAPYSEIGVVMRLQNTTANAVALSFSATLIDSQARTLLQTSGHAFTIAASTTTDVDLDLHNTSEPAGTYSVLVQGFDGNGALVVEGSASVDIVSSARISGNIVLNPPVAQAGATLPVSISPTISNHGNVPVPAGQVELTITLDAADANYSPLGQTTVGPPILSNGFLARPVGGVYDAQGVLWILNGDNGRIIRAAPQADGSYVATVFFDPAVDAPAPNPFPNPVALTIDNAGNLYVLNSSTTIYKVAPSKSLTKITTNLFGQNAIAWAGNNHLYVSLGSGASSIVSVDAATGASSPVAASGFDGPAGIAVAADGTAYVSSAGNTIVKMSPGGAISTFISSGLSGPKGLAINTAGDLLIADSGSNRILKATTGGTPTLSPYGTGANLSSPGPIALAADGTLFVANTGNNTIVQVPSGGGTAQPFVKSLLNNATGLTYDASGNLFAVDNEAALVKVDPAGVITFLNGVAGATYVAPGPSNNVIIASSNGSLVPFPSAGGDTVTGLSWPVGMAFAGGTSMYVAERTGHRVSLVNMATKAVSAFAPSFVNSGDDLYFASNGDRLILNGNRIDRVGATSGTTTKLLAGGQPFSAQSFLPIASGGFYLESATGLATANASGAVTPLATTPALSTTLGIGMAFDNAGNLLVADRFARKVMQVNPATGAMTTFADLSGFTQSSLWSIASDGAGGVFAGLSDGKVVRAPAGGAPSLLVTLPGTPRRIAFDATTGTVYAKLDGSVRMFTLANPTLVSTTPIPGGTNGTLQFANGQVHVINDRAELRSYSPQGVLASTLAGFDTPTALVFDGTRVIVADAVKTISIVPGQLPTTLADETVTTLAISQGTLFGTRVNVVYTLAPGARTYTSYWPSTDMGLGLLTGLAARADGALTIASREDHRVLTIDAQKNVIASYAGVNSPTGIAIDAAGDVYVANFRQLTRIIRATGQSFVLDSFALSTGIGFFNGQLYGASGGRLLRYSSLTSPAAIAFSDEGAGYNHVFATSSGLYVTDGAKLKISRWDGSAMTPLASGLANVDALAVAGDGTLYAGGKYGSVTRVSPQAITQLSGELGNVSALAVGPSGRVYAGSATGQVTAFEPVSFKRTDITSLSQVAGIASNRGPVVQYLTSDSSEVLAGGVGNSPTEAYRIRYTPPPAPPAAGTVVYSTRVNMADLPVGATQSIAGIPPWPIPYPGDFRFSLHRVDSVTGEGVNQLHVGPSATGSITVGAAKVPPGDSSVHVTAVLKGADFVTVATVDPSRAALAFEGFARLMGADALGRIYFGFGGSSIFRTTASGVGTELASNIFGSGSIVTGTIPFDNNQNFYVVGGTGNKEIFGVSSATLQQVSHAVLTEPVISIVRDSQDTLWALTSSFDPAINRNVGRIYHVVPNATTGTVTVLNTGVFRAPFSLAIDGRDNLYVHTQEGTASSTAIFKVARDGATSVTVVSDLSNPPEPSFEFEGVNMAGDCADNIIVTPLVWKKYGQGAGWQFTQPEEEHTLIQVNGTTGKVTRVWDSTSLNTDLTDVDAIVYDRFGGQLLILSERWVTGGRSVIYRVPLTCGSINTDFHVVVPPGQATTGFTTTPNSTIVRTDGSRELVWNLNALQNSGQSLGFDTKLAGLSLGETRAIASEAFLFFQDTFLANQVKVPLAVPTVTADGMVDVAVAMNPSSYPSNTPISSSVTLTSRDPGSRTVTLVVTITDAQNALVAQVAQQAVTVPAGGSVPVPVAFNTGTYLSGSYLVKAQLLDPATGIALSNASAGFDILADATSIITSISSDKVSYQPVDTLTLDARGKNVSVNAIVTNLKLAVVVRDPSGNVLFSGDRTLGTLVPGALQDAFFRFQLSGAQSGQYTAEVSATPAGDPPIPVRTTTFTVLSTTDTGSGVQGSLSAPNVANTGDTVNLVALITNHGNAALTNIPVTFRVINPVTGTAIFTQATTASVAQGGEVSVTQPWNTTGAAAGTYVAAATATFSGREISLGQATIRIGAIQPFSFTAVTNAPVHTPVESNPITVTGILAPAKISITGGEFQIGNGAWSGSDDFVQPGNVVTVRVMTATTLNTTTTAHLTIAGVSADFSVTTLVPDTTPEPFSFTPLTGVAPGSVQASNEITVSGITAPAQISITGGTYSVNNTPFTSSTTTVNNGDKVVVQVTASSTLGGTAIATVTIGGVSATFSVTTTTLSGIPNITATPSLTALERLLVLVACKTTDDADDDAACVAQRVAFLGPYLNALGIANTIVTTEDAFRVEMRSGRYDAYWISSGAKKLGATIAAELVEAGFRGETLVIDGVHDSRNKVLDDVVGVLYRGKPAHLDTVTLSGTFLPAGTFTPGGAAPIRVDLGTGVRQARFNTGDAAIVTNDFGLGNGLLFSFDLVGTLMAQPGSTMLKATLAGALDYVAPSVPVTFTGGAYVPFSLDIKNKETAAITLDVSVTLPAGFVLVTTTPPASQTGSTVTWHVTIAAGATLSLEGAVRAPDASGTYTLPFVVSQATTIGTFPLVVIVKGLDSTLPQVIAALQALSPPAQADRAARDRAVTWLQAAQTSISQAHWEDAIAQLAGAAQDLDSMAIDVAAQRTVVDNVIKEVERRWWAALPPCPATPACR